MEIVRNHQSWSSTPVIIVWVLGCGVAILVARRIIVVANGDPLGVPAALISAVAVALIIICPGVLAWGSWLRKVKLGKE